MSNYIQYLELDSQDGLYKNHRQVLGYNVGELFIVSKTPKLLDSYKLKVLHQGDLYYEDLKIEENSINANNSAIFEMAFSRLQGQWSRIHIRFRAYLVRGRAPNDNYTYWILHELQPAPLVLDQLEQEVDYILVGESR